MNACKQERPFPARRPPLQTAPGSASAGGAAQRKFIVDRCGKFVHFANRPHRDVGIPQDPMGMARGLISPRRPSFDDGSKFGGLFGANITHGQRKNAGEFMIVVQAKSVNQFQMPIRLSGGDRRPVAKVEMKRVTGVRQGFGRDALFEAFVVEAPGRGGAPPPSAA